MRRKPENNPVWELPGIGGMYDSFANAYVSLANKEDFSYKLETRNTAGSAANVRLLSGKYIELGIAQADLVEEAYHGTGEFRDKAYQGYKAVAALYPGGMPDRRAHGFRD